MENSGKKVRYAYRLPPCPSYDVEGMEHWLEAMAQKGLFLIGDGFFAGIGAFEKAAPQAVKYRLEAAPKHTSIWTDDGDDPDPEAVALNARYAWEYVAKRGSFYIYRSSDPQARELNTDPEVQALTIQAVQKRQAGAAFTILFWLVLYPLLSLRGGLLLTMINARTWYFLFTSLLALWLCAGSLWEVIFLGRLKGKLRAGHGFAPPGDRGRRTALYLAKNAAQLLLIVAWVCVSLNRWSVSVLEEDKLPLQEYETDPPFATMADLAGEGEHTYQMTMFGKRFNAVQEWSDWLAPRNLNWSEQAKITRPDGTVLDGGLTVCYHEAVSPSVAERLVSEYERADRRDGFDPLDLPPLDVDYAIAYMDELHFPTLLLQKGNVVIRASFYQTSTNTMALADWASRMAHSVK